MVSQQGASSRPGTSDLANAASENSKEKGEPSLTSTLTILQRTQLIQLLAAATAVQRDTLSDVFTAAATLPPELQEDLESSRTSDSKDNQDLNPNIDPGKVDVAAFDEARKRVKTREEELKKPEVEKLRKAVLEWFDAWRFEMIQRVGEAVRLKKEAKRRLEEDPQVKDMTPQRKHPEEQKLSAQSLEGMGSEEADLQGKENEKADDRLKSLYPPIPTPLRQLERDKRVLVLHSMLLLLLSLKHYTAPSRVLLLYLCTSLDLPLSVLDSDETKTATGLIEGAKELSAKEEAEKKAQENQSSRKWKVGLATAAGAAIIGITGGMAAPLVAAGVGSVMGGLGLGATAAAGYLGSLAGSTMLVGGLFGAYGGRMTGQMMDNYAKEVDDFAFLPVHDTHTAQEQAHNEKSGRPKLDRQQSEQRDVEAGQKNPHARRLRVTVGISGWLTEDDEVISPWHVLGQNTEAFALRFELEALMNLGNAMNAMVSSAAWGYAKKTVISHTVFAELMSAMWPLGLLQVSRVVDNPFSIAKARADKAGVVLADALVNRAQGERPVNLIGYSLGARVIYSCLQELAKRHAFGLVDSAVLIGTPAPSTAPEWRALRASVSGRLVNIYSENDYVLGFLYRTSSVQLGVAGLQRVEAVAGVENVDVSETVSGHLRYRYLVGSILQQIGWEDLSAAGLRHEKEALEQMEREQREMSLKEKGMETGLMVAGFEKTGDQTAEPDDGSSEKGGKDAGKMSDEQAQQQVERMEKEVQDKTQMTLLQRGAQYLAAYRAKGAMPDAGKALEGTRAAAYATTGAARDAASRARDAAVGAAGTVRSSMGNRSKAAADAGVEQVQGARSQGKDSASKTQGQVQGQGQGQGQGYGSYLPNMPNMSNMPDMPSMPNIPKLPKVSTPNWSSWGGKDGKPAGRQQAKTQQQQQQPPPNTEAKKQT